MSALHLPITDKAPGLHRTSPTWLNLIREAVESADYGTVQIKVHGGEVVQIEATRKIRVPGKPAPLSFSPTASAEETQP